MLAPHYFKATNHHIMATAPAMPTQAKTISVRLGLGDLSLKAPAE
jgi:hypothetical protein